VSTLAQVTGVFGAYSTGFSPVLLLPSTIGLWFGPPSRLSTPSASQCMQKVLFWDSFCPRLTMGYLLYRSYVWGDSLLFLATFSFLFPLHYYNFANKPRIPFSHGSRQPVSFPLLFAEMSFLHRSAAVSETSSAPTFLRSFSPRFSAVLQYTPGDVFCPV